MAKIDRDTRQTWVDHPRRQVNLILTVSGDIQKRSETLAERGARVRRRFRMTHAISVRCTGELALSLLRSSWVQRIEPDRPIKILGR